jgi:Kef-type K+ transport system membrane component KefB
MILEPELRQFLLAVVTLLAAAHFTGYLFERFKLPRVIGEITGGIVVGKTGLGHVAPDLHQWLFHAFDGEFRVLSALYWMGLILLMFTSGFSMERKAHPSDRRLLLILVVITTVFPFLAGWIATSTIDFSPFLGPARHPVALSLVVGIAVAVTSIPVIARIFLDLGVAETRFARTVMSVAVAHDILLWVVLAVAVGLVGATAPTLTLIALIVGKTALFFVISLTLGPPALRRLSRARFNLVQKASPVGWVLVVCFLLAALASVLEINVVFGALVAGLLFGATDDGALEHARSRIRDFSFAFFVPFYFAMVGMKLDLVNQLDLGFTIAFVAFCTVTQMAATMAGVRLAGRGWSLAVNYGIAMNARGGPGIVLATVALETGIIGGAFYSTLVVLSIVTSLATGMWFRRQLALGIDLDAGHGQLEPPAKAT